ncbi:MULTISPECIES: sulfate ABC transporter permease subunit CysT [unclassified Synechococcus]|uniref:sulfate ABC transporter permease subunit CysT n=1 Tax=unclassified Synechococcus TaxID=2626047 RepID=UPI0021A8540D|nr:MULTISPECIES: sulfate ABC transporter permease subunit CysT [unclassified Synechococcus]MCT0212478.1 sulfate ABC transporter permease subunit CysT [Synechococcus sp. CS-1326]MCT0231995.1 sulfate ABC transporter permease subunit CysT [Synechococcus sp. CS-1327]
MSSSVIRRWHLPRLELPSWPWRFTWLYLGLVLFLPLGGLLLRAAGVGPARFWELATTPEALATYQVSFGLALVAASLNGVFGLLIAWALVRSRFPGQRLLDALIDLPFALPTAVAGLSLSAVYSTNGWIGAPLYAWFGLKVAFNWPGVLVAMVFISLPFVVRTVEPVLRALEAEQEEAAWCLGARAGQTFFKVVLPQLMPAILAGVAQGYSRAVGEYGSVVMISSNVPFRDLIAPTLIIQKLEEYDIEAATVIGTVMLLFSLVSLLVINLLQVWGLRYAEDVPRV